MLVLHADCGTPVAAPDPGGSSMFNRLHGSESFNVLIQAHSKSLLSPALFYQVF